MRIAVNGDDSAGRTLGDLVEQARVVERDGLAGYWLPQIFGLDSVTALVVIGREVPRLELGVAVVPTYTRHPLALAQQAITAQIATDGRFLLGIGPSHQMVVEHLLGLSYEAPLRHVREYLTVLRGLIDDGASGFSGETLRVQVAVDIPERSPVPILLAALGPRMLDLAGTVADGTITWMTGPATLEAHVIPTITAAAERVGRPAPRVGVSLPICVTDDPDAARTAIAERFSVYGMLPAYRAMLDREGVEGPGDVAIVGDEDTVAAALRHLAGIGVTDFAAREFGSPAELARTRAVLKSLL